MHEIKIIQARTRRGSSVGGADLRAQGGREWLRVASINDYPHLLTAFSSHVFGTVLMSAASSSLVPQSLGRANGARSTASMSVAGSVEKLMGGLAVRPFT